MSRFAASLTVGSSTVEKEIFRSVKVVADPVPATGYAAAKTAYDAAAATLVTDLATLVADGATPTQGHVNTVNTDYTALAAAYTTLAAALAAPPTAVDVVLSIDAAAVGTKTCLAKAVARLLHAVSGSDRLTP